MDHQEPASGNSIGRRNFLSSFFGLKTSISPTSKSSYTSFYWADLKSGQIGFPTGLGVLPQAAGSILRLVAAAILVERNLIDVDQTFDCSGSLCNLPHGKITLVQALACSCDQFFTHTLDKISAEEFLEQCKQLGLSEPVAGYCPGTFPQEPIAKSIDYVLGNYDHLRPNTLQVLRLSALIAKRGEIPVLHSAEDSPDENAGACNAPLQLREETWDVLQQAMVLAAEHGSFLDPQKQLHLALMGCSEFQSKQFHSLITGYFPSNDPRYAFCITNSDPIDKEVAISKANDFLLSTVWP